MRKETNVPFFTSACDVNKEPKKKVAQFHEAQTV
jgi:hypothetical protein